MNASLTDELYSQLEGAPLQRMSQQLGVGPAQMAGAVSAALPLLIGALGRNASRDDGADAFVQRLDSHGAPDVHASGAFTIARPTVSTRVTGCAIGLICCFSSPFEARAT